MVAFKTKIVVRMVLNNVSSMPKFNCLRHLGSGKITMKYAYFVSFFRAFLSASALFSDSNTLHNSALQVCVFLYQHPASTAPKRCLAARRHNSSKDIRRQKWCMVKQQCSIGRILSAVVHLSWELSGPGLSVRAFSK